jgi:uncharacterized phage protein (TIGR02220 family)
LSIYRVKKNANYVVMNRTVLNDDRLSWKAKGLHAYMLSMPDDWVFYNEELAKHSADGIAVIKSSIKELKQYGYLVRKPMKDDKGKILSWETHVYECPEVDFPPTGKPTDREIHPMGNQPLLSTDSLPITETLLNTDKKDIPYFEIVSYLNEKTNSKYKPTNKKTKDLIHARWNEGFELEDFKTVIDKKSSEWLTDSTMNKYLRPETLFGTKFESYLNQKGGQPFESTRGNFKGVKSESRSYDDEISRREKERPSFIKSV